MVRTHGTYMVRTWCVHSAYMVHTQCVLRMAHTWCVRMVHDASLCEFPGNRGGLRGTFTKMFVFFSPNSHYPKELNGVDIENK